MKNERAQKNECFWCHGAKHSKSLSKCTHLSINFAPLRQYKSVLISNSACAFHQNETNQDKKYHKRPWKEHRTHSQKHPHKAFHFWHKRPSGCWKEAMGCQETRIRQWHCWKKRWRTMILTQCGCLVSAASLGWAQNRTCAGQKSCTKRQWNKKMKWDVHCSKKLTFMQVFFDMNPRRVVSFTTHTHECNKTTNELPDK